ncbi:hypothetical protein M885DRAFT_614334 [Pelagophyceae sp. CCMP2097]|nr:hypothetical protein M885DRAFT_614334 [Pelagophyceae sp. CCMP2097]
MATIEELEAALLRCEEEATAAAARRDAAAARLRDAAARLRDARAAHAAPAPDAAQTSAVKRPADDEACDEAGAAPKKPRADEDAADGASAEATVASAPAAVASAPADAPMGYDAPGAAPEMAVSSESLFGGPTGTETAAGSLFSTPAADSLFSLPASDAPDSLFSTPAAAESTPAAAESLFSTAASDAPTGDSFAAPTADSLFSTPAADALFAALPDPSLAPVPAAPPAEIFVPSSAALFGEPSPSAFSASLFGGAPDAPPERRPAPEPEESKAATPSSVVSALLEKLGADGSELSQQLFGRPAAPAATRVEPRAAPPGRDLRPPPQLLDSDSCTIFIGNLAMRACRDASEMEHAVRALFSRCGMVIAVRLSDNGRGFGHVDFDQPRAAKLATELNGSLLLGRRMKVDLADKKVEQPPMRGRGPPPPMMMQQPMMQPPFQRGEPPAFRGEPAFRSGGGEASAFQSGGGGGQPPAFRSGGGGGELSAFRSEPAFRSGGGGGPYSGGGGGGPMHAHSPYGGSGGGGPPQLAHQPYVPRQQQQQQQQQPRNAYDFPSGRQQQQQFHPQHPFHPQGGGMGGPRMPAGRDNARDNPRDAYGNPYGGLL